MILLAIQLAVDARQGHAQQQNECGDRMPLQVVITDDSGTIRLPGAGQATPWAEFGDDSSEELVVSLEGGRAQQVELRVLFKEGGAGRLAGRVVDGATDEPIGTATVSIIGEFRSVESDRRGRFVLSGVPAGAREIEVRRIGYEALRHRVTVTRGLTAELEIGLVPMPVEMEPLVATVIRPRRLEIGGFYERKYWGELVSGGSFFTADDIDRRRPLRISHMLADVPGVRVRCSGSGINSCRIESARRSEGFSGGGCDLNVYLDGTLVRGGGVDEFVLPIEIAGIEVYAGPAQLPAEFAGSDARCGAVVIWTK